MAWGTSKLDYETTSRLMMGWRDVMLRKDQTVETFQQFPLMGVLRRVCNIRCYQLKVAYATMFSEKASHLLLWHEASADVTATRPILDKLYQVYITQNLQIFF